MPQMTRPDGARKAFAHLRQARIGGFSCGCQAPAQLQVFQVLLCQCRLQLCVSCSQDCRVLLCCLQPLHLLPECHSITIRQGRAIEAQLAKELNLP